VLPRHLQWHSRTNAHGRGCAPCTLPFSLSCNWPGGWSLKERYGRMARRWRIICWVKCVFHAKTATDSRRILPPIPRQSCHLFHTNAAT